MNLRMLRHFLNGGVIVVRLLFIVLFMLWPQVQADAQIIIVPIEEVKFEAPALPPPLWRTNLLVMRELALPAMQTFSEKATTAAPKFSLMPSTVRTVLSYEHVSGDFGRTTSESDEGEGLPREKHEIEFDGDVVSIYSKIAWNTHRISVGTMIFYDSLGLDSFDMHRVGIMFFGKHQWPISQSLDIGLTANGNYARNIMDSRIHNVDFQDFNTFGGNISISLEFDTREIYRVIAISEPKISRLYFAGGLSLSYQFQKDDVEREGFRSGEVVQEVDDQHLLMLGANFGMRMGSRFAMTIYGIWNYDATEYKGSLRDTDDNYLDVILEGSWSLLPRGKVNFGYKRILFYQEIDSNQIFVGISWRF